MVPTVMYKYTGYLHYIQELSKQKTAAIVVSITTGAQHYSTLMKCFERSRARTGFARSNTAIVGSNPT
jgi:hypothetical protein